MDKLFEQISVSYSSYQSSRSQEPRSSRKNRSGVPISMIADPPERAYPVQFRLVLFKVSE